MPYVPGGATLMNPLKQDHDEHRDPRQPVSPLHWDGYGVPGLDIEIEYIEGLSRRGSLCLKQGVALKVMATNYTLYKYVVKDTPTLRLILDTKRDLTYSHADGPWLDQLQRGAIL